MPLIVLSGFSQLDRPSPFRAESSLVVWMDHDSMHLPIKRHLDCSQDRAVMNTTVMNICGQVFCVWTWSFQLFWVNSRESDCRSYSKGLFTVLRNFHSSWTLLRAHQHGVRVPAAPQPLRCSVVSGFWVLAAWIGVSVPYVIVLICIPLMTYDVEHLKLIFHLYILLDEVSVKIFYFSHAVTIKT